MPVVLRFALIWLLLAGAASAGLAGASSPSPSSRSFRRWLAPVDFVRSTDRLLVGTQPQRQRLDPVVRRCLSTSGMSLLVSCVASCRRVSSCSSLPDLGNAVQGDDAIPVPRLLDANLVQHQVQSPNRADSGRIRKQRTHRLRTTWPILAGHGEQPGLARNGDTASSPAMWPSASFNNSKPSTPFGLQDRVDQGRGLGQSLDQSRAAGLSYRSFSVVFGATLRNSSTHSPSAPGIGHKRCIWKIRSSESPPCSRCRSVSLRRNSGTNWRQTRPENQAPCPPVPEQHAAIPCPPASRKSRLPCRVSPE